MSSRPRPARRKTWPAIAPASGPLIRTTPIPPSPTAVAIAAMVSWYIISWISGTLSPDRCATIAVIGDHSSRGRGPMIILDEPLASPQYVVALVIAAPLLGAGIVLALIVARFSAWYARRWRGPRDE